jgi:hypothetical protein
VIDLRILHFIFKIIFQMANTKTSKRSYIRRKKFLVENAQTIETTLSLIEQRLGKNIFPQPLSQLAQFYSKTIEASCWDPKLKIDNERYQQLTTFKTDELCRALLYQHCGDCVRSQMMVNRKDQTFIPRTVRHIPFREEISPMLSRKVQLPPVSTLLSA